MRIAAALVVMLSLPGLARAQTPAAPRPAHPHSTPHSPPPQHPAPAHKAPTVPPQSGPLRRHPAPHPAPPPPPPVPTPEPEKPPEPAQKGSVTSLPLPRFAALRSEEVNFRSGPGVRYPIDWVYKRRDLPVEIEREFEVWRLVEDSEGVKGWVHQATLAPRRTGVVTGAEQILRQSADDTAAAVARLKPGVILRLRSCDAGSDWCQAQVGDYRGWIKRNQFWGTFPGEAVQ